MSKPVHQVNSPAGIVEALPTLLGFHPTESLVVIAFNGPRNRVGLTMRLDLIATRRLEGETLAHYAQTIRDKQDSGVAVIALTSDTITGMWVVDQMVDAIGVEVVARGVADDGTLTDHHTGQSWTYSDPTTSVATTLAVSEGQVIAGSRDEIMTSLSPITPTDPALDEPTTLTVEEVMTVVATYPDRDRQAARRTLIAAANDRQIQGAIITAMPTDHATREVWTDVARHAHRTNAADAYAIAAAAWLRTGAGMQARQCVHHALTRQHDHVMANLLDKALDLAIHPDLIWSALSE